MTNTSYKIDLWHGPSTTHVVGASSFLEPEREPSRDYEIPREVADALSDVMGEHELYEAFFCEPVRGTVWDKTG
ncbi:MAG: hypothetical protein M3323_03885 [Actinomycetota bacterium]|nr:hypothetical protein [Actinomycetota bacterium]